VTSIFKYSHTLYTEKCVRCCNELFVIPFPHTNSLVESILRTDDNSSRSVYCLGHLKFWTVAAVVHCKTLLSVGSSSLILLLQNELILSCCLCPSSKWSVRLNFTTKICIFSLSFLLHGMCCYVLFHLIAAIIAMAIFSLPYRFIVYKPSQSPLNIFLDPFIFLFFLLNKKSTNHTYHP
jgi:hypothetical protein